MRQVIAKRLTSSKSTIPHSYLSKVLRSDKLKELRKTFAESGIKLSVNDLVIKAVAGALEKCPNINVQWDAATQEAKHQSAIDISVAVAIDGGLITPIITNANQKNLLALNAEMKELAGLAKAGKLVPKQFQGGSFSISNLGMFGIEEFTAVINPPQCCILAVGGTQQEVYMDESGSVKVRDIMSVALSFDSRAVVPSDAAQFLEELAYLVQNPETLCL